MKKMVSDHEAAQALTAPVLDQEPDNKIEAAPENKTEDTE